MFSVQNAGIHYISTVWKSEKNQTQSSAERAWEDSDSNDEHHSHRSSSTVSSRSNSMSLKPVDHTAAGHMRSSTFGNQLWLEISENVRTVEVRSVWFLSVLK